MEVSYFNPFKVVTLEESLDIQQLQEVAHMFPEVVGVALRNAVECPVEISLITDSIKKHQLFTKRRPFLFASCVIWILILLVKTLVGFHLAKLYQETFETKSRTVQSYIDTYSAIKDAEAEQKKSVDKTTAINDILTLRGRWTTLYNTLQKAKPIDIWLDYVNPINKPIIDPNTVAEVREEDTPQNDDIIFQEPGSGSSSQAAAGKVEWLDIRGHCVTIPESERKKGSDEDVFVRRIFTDSQFEILAGLIKERDDLAAAKNLGTMSDKFDELHSAIEAGNRINLTTNLPQALVDALRILPAFSDDPSETRVVTYQLNANFQNVKTFQIQVKLTPPISTVLP